MQLTVLVVEGCPNAPVLEHRLAAVLQGRPDVSVSREVISSEGEALRWAMHGSPTLLIDGVDPFADPAQPPSMSCRGVGRLLMTALYEVAAEHGCSRVEWTTDTDNAGAMAFYARLGVHIEGARPTRIGLEAVSVGTLIGVTVPD